MSAISEPSATALERAERLVRDIVVGLFGQDITDEQVSAVAAKVVRAIPHHQPGPVTENDGE